MNFEFYVDQDPAFHSNADPDPADILFLFLVDFVLLFEKLAKVTLTFSFIREHGKDERYKAIEKSRDRESMFNEYIIDMKKKVSLNLFLHLSGAEGLCNLTNFSHFGVG